MILNLAMVFSTIHFSAPDTMLLPLRNGIVLEAPRSCLGKHESDGIDILPTDDFEARSCSAAKVTMVQRYDDNRYAVVLRTDSLYYAYYVDTIYVAKGDSVQKAQVIGKLKQQLEKGETREEFPLRFFVFEKGTFVNPGKYLFYSEALITKVDR